MKARSFVAALVALLGTAAFASARPGVGAPPQTQCAPGAAMSAAMTPVASQLPKTALNAMRMNGVRERTARGASFM